MTGIGAAGAVEPRGAPASMADLVTGDAVVVCCGSGGVGKTTTAAVMALEGARRGRKAVVVTIDPARRLADALGLEGLTNTPHPIDGDWPGELWALMLDTKSTFDNLVATYAGDDEQAAGILENRFYRNISGALSGTQEYMAMEKLHELHDSGDFDLIVVDTPPTRNALDFLDAPRHLTRFLDHRLYRLLMAPTRGVVKAMNVATQAFLRSVSKVVGGDAVQDAIAFFQAFEGMEAGFKERAERVQALLADDATSFVLVASPRADTVSEAAYFAQKLDDANLTVRALVVNRMHPRFGTVPPDAARQRSLTLAGTDLGGLYANLADFAEVASREEEHVAALGRDLAHAIVVRVPFLASDVHDLDGMAEVGTHLFSPESTLDSRR
jgi:anion-transporting  ArsA/GET3 family ATPase